MVRERGWCCAVLSIRCCGGLAAVLVASHAFPDRAFGVGLEPRAAVSFSGSVRGLVRARHQSALATDIVARVAKIFVREAQSFTQGEKLLEFDCRQIEAAHRAAEAAYREAALMLESQSYLDRKGAVGRFDVEMARARADRVRAEADGLKARIEQCTVTAPFNGRVVELAIAEHEIPQAGRPFMVIVDDQEFEIELIVPSLSLSRLASGQVFEFHIEETAESHPAIIDRLGAAVDPVSQTVKVIGKFVRSATRVLPGMSGTADFAPKETPK